MGENLIGEEPWGSLRKVVGGEYGQGTVHACM